tara:strand:+ start:1273 stop:1968 length:696 start_codon:yes stop_codon:yes gene_type:complete
MLQSINKYKLYLYLFFLLFLSSIFNFKFLENYQDMFILKNININGVSYKEKKYIEEELYKLKNTNIFKITENKVLDILTKFNFIDSTYVKKVLPSSININILKTDILAKTFINGEVFYIGKNGKFINLNQIFEQYKTATVFGEFEIKEFLNLYNILSNQQLEIANIEQYYYFKNRRWDLVFSNKLVLKLPSKNKSDSIKIYKQLLDNGNLTNIKIIDLRVNNQIIMTNKNE